MPPGIPQKELLRGKNRTRRIASWGKMFKSTETQFSLVNDNSVASRCPPRFHKKNCFEEKIAQEELLRGGKFLNLPKPNFPQSKIILWLPVGPRDSLNNVYVVGSSISLLRTGKWVIGSQIRCPCLVAPRGLPIRGPPLAPDSRNGEFKRTNFISSQN